MPTYTRKNVAELIDGTIDPDTLNKTLSEPKDADGSRLPRYSGGSSTLEGQDHLPFGPKLYCGQVTATKHGRSVATAATISVTRRKTGSCTGW